MTRQELVDYIVSELTHGTSEAEIRNALGAAGWQEPDINENLNHARQHMLVAPHLPHKETKEKLVFLKRHTKPIVVMCLIGLLLAGAAFGAYKYVIPPPPEKVLHEALAAEFNSFDFSGRITADVDTPDNILNLQALLPQEILDQIADKRVAGASTNIQFAMDIKGTIDATDEQHPKTEIQIDLSSGIFTVGMEVKVIDEIVYLRLENIPKITEEITKYSNTWIKIDPVSLSKEYGLGINLQNAQPDLTDGQKKQLQELLTQTKFVSSITKLPNDTINGMTMYHYGLTIDRIALKNYLNQVDKIQKSAGGMTTSTSELIDSLRFNEVEIWIGKSDRMIYRMSGKISQVASADSIPTSGSVNLLLNLSNFNNTKPIVAPSDSRNVQEVIKELMAEPAVPVKK